MSGKKKKAVAAVDRFTLAHARAEQWSTAAKLCQDGIAQAVPGANLGFLYATEAFAADLPSILTFLRGTTRIQHWVGGVVPGLCVGGEEIRDGGALAVMVGALPEGSFRCFSGLDADALRGDLGDWQGLALVHGDPRNPGLPALVEATAGTGGFLVGGLTSLSGPPAQVADTVVSGGVSGITLQPSVAAVCGLTQGCSPLGGEHRITEAWEGVLMALDGRPALEVLKDEAGELIARDIRRAAGYIHVGLPVAGSDTGDYLVRNLVGIDPRKNWLAIGERLETGGRLMFVRRDANAAQADLRRMVADVVARLDGRRPRAAFYVTCVGRGRHMFGTDGLELATLAEALGPEVPLIGFFANGEISRDRLYGYTGVMAVLT